MPTMTSVSGDTDGDDDVDEMDLIHMFNDIMSDDTGMDLDYDGKCNYRDIFIFTIQWGLECPKPTPQVGERLEQNRSQSRPNVHRY